MRHLGFSSSSHTKKVLECTWTCKCFKPLQREVHFTFTDDKGTKICLSCCIKQAFSSFIIFMLRRLKPFSKHLCMQDVGNIPSVKFCESLLPASFRGCRRETLQYWGLFSPKKTSHRVKHEWTSFLFSRRIVLEGFQQAVFPPPPPPPLSKPNTFVT